MASTKTQNELLAQRRLDRVVFIVKRLDELRFIEYRCDGDIDKVIRFIETCKRVDADTIARRGRRTLRQSEVRRRHVRNLLKKIDARRKL